MKLRYLWPLVLAFASCGTPDDKTPTNSTVNNGASNGMTAANNTTSNGSTGTTGANNAATQNGTTGTTATTTRTGGTTGGGCVRPCLDGQRCYFDEACLGIPPAGECYDDRDCGDGQVCEGATYCPSDVTCIAGTMPGECG